MEFLVSLGIFFVMLFILKKWFDGGTFSENSRADLSGKVAIVTGGIGGIGREVTEALVARKCYVVIADID